MTVSMLALSVAYGLDGTVRLMPDCVEIEKHIPGGYSMVQISLMNIEGIEIAEPLNGEKRGCMLFLIKLKPTWDVKTMAVLFPSSKREEFDRLRALVPIDRAVKYYKGKKEIGCTDDANA